MTITRQMLDTTYVCWFRNKRNTEKAKQEILKRFSEELFHHKRRRDISARGEPLASEPAVSGGLGFGEDERAVGQRIEVLCRVGVCGIDFR